MKFHFEEIGIIESEYKEKKNVPIQSRFSNSKAIINIHSKFEEGLKDLDGFSHAILIYVFNKSKESKLLVKPFLDEKERGVFSTRAPKRPNPIGISVVKIDKIVDNKIYISKNDILDGTPILDIKPYVKEFDSIESATNGWIDGKIKETHVSDSRFD
jgi:tRNA-Thr(GGU) m(6)t(6)A37 methyltransferase TsaA